MSEHEPPQEPDHEPLHDSLLGGSAHQEPTHHGGRRRRRGSSGCLPILVVLAVIVVLGVIFVPKAVDKIKDQFADPADYPGPGSGKVSFQVHSGDTITVMGRNLEQAGVVASVEAFTHAAGDNPKSTGIQAGFYTLKKKMSAAGALTVLVDPDNIVSTNVTIPEGLRASSIVALLADKTDYSTKQFQKVLDKPDKLGLPSYAGGKVEGYLFPATYAFPPDATPESMLTAMVDRFKQAADDADLEGEAKKLGYTPAEIVTVASLVQAEGRGDDMPKVARVIYNRLENPGAEGTIGRLQIDATVAYALGENPGVALTESQLDVDSPYNTRTHEGLPPGPIDSPGDDALAAATHPASGAYYYYVTVNLKTGETKFAKTPEEFQQYKNEFLQYCQTSSAC